MQQVVTNGLNAMSIYRDKYTYKADGKTIWRLYESSASSNTPKMKDKQYSVCIEV